MKNDISLVYNIWFSWLSYPTPHTPACSKLLSVIRIMHLHLSTCTLSVFLEADCPCSSESTHPCKKDSGVNPITSLSREVTAQLSPHQNPSSKFLKSRSLQCVSPLKPSKFTAVATICLEIKDTLTKLFKISTCVLEMVLSYIYSSGKN